MQDEYGNTVVNWNYPPAFPGKVATGPGHLAESERMGEEEEDRGAEDEDREGDEDNAEDPMVLGTSDLVDVEFGREPAMIPNEMEEEPSEEAAAMTEGLPQASDGLTSLTFAREVEYTVSEAETDDHGQEGDVDDIVTVPDETTGDKGYTVEEPVTEGRLTEVIFYSGPLFFSVTNMFLLLGAARKGDQRCKRSHNCQRGAPVFR